MTVINSRGQTVKADTVKRTGIYRSSDGVQHFYVEGFEFPPDEELVLVEATDTVTDDPGDPDDAEGKAVAAAPENKMAKAPKTKNPDSVAAKLEGS